MSAAFVETQSYNMRSPERRVLGMLNSNTYSPTANLQLLTSVASNLALREEARLARSKGGSGRQSGCKPRKDKSLGILCDKFLAMFPLRLEDSCFSVEINLDKVSAELGIVKRRIYDIINILESLHMTSRIAKNRYEWYGDRDLKAALSHLRKLAVKYEWEQKIKALKLKQQQDSVQQYKCSNASSPCPNGCYDECEKEISSSSSQTDDFLYEERTLGIMCQKFIMLFLVSEEGEMVNLDLATQMLVNSPVRPAFAEPALNGKVTNQACCRRRLKTKIRRLYDIANVLISLGLIRKEWLVVDSLRKHGFLYSGPRVEDTTESLTLGPAEKLRCLGGQGPTETSSPPTRLGSLDDILRIAEQELKLLSQAQEIASDPSPPTPSPSPPPQAAEVSQVADPPVTRSVCVVEALSAHNYAAVLPEELHGEGSTAAETAVTSVEESPIEIEEQTEKMTKEETIPAVDTSPAVTSSAEPTEVRFTVTRTLAPSNMIVRKLNSGDLKVTIHHALGGSFIRLQPVGSSQKLALPVASLKALKPTKINVIKAPQGVLGSLGVIRSLEIKKAVQVVPVRSGDACP